MSEPLDKNDPSAEVLMAAALQAVATVALLEYAVFGSSHPDVPTHVNARGNELASKLFKERSNSQTATRADALHCIRRCAGMLDIMAAAEERLTDAMPLMRDSKHEPPPPSPPPIPLLAPHRRCPACSKKPFPFSAHGYITHWKELPNELGRWGICNNCTTLTKLPD